MLRVSPAHACMWAWTALPPSDFATAYILSRTATPAFQAVALSHVRTISFLKFRGGLAASFAGKSHRHSPAYVMV